MVTQTYLHFRSARWHRRPGLHNGHNPARDTRNFIGVYAGDRRLAPDEEPPPGAHLVTPRVAYAHHGIYVGNGKVVHYGAFAHQLRSGPVEEVSSAYFAHGHSVYVRPHAAPRFDCNEVIRRARFRLGEDKYRLLRNNCEHFCEWCVQGEPRSRQVERALTLPRALVRTAYGAIARMLAERGRVLGS